MRHCPYLHMTSQSLAPVATCSHRCFHMGIDACMQSYFESQKPCNHACHAKHPYPDSHLGRITPADTVILEPNQPSQASLDSLAEALNGAILGHQGLPAVSPLERAFQQTTVVLDQLRTHAPQSTIIDLRQMVLGDVGSGGKA